MDTYNVIKTSDLGNEYVIGSHRSVNNGHSLLLVAGLYNNTNVQILNGSAILHSVVIHELDVFQFSSQRIDDLTGVHVVSDKNIFVVAGSSYAYATYVFTAGFDDFMSSEMIPVSPWSNSYIVPSLVPRLFFSLRILSGKSYVNVTVSNITNTISTKASLNYLRFEDDVVVLTAERPFSVIQYGPRVELGYHPGGSFMTVVPAVNEYVNSYTFTVPRAYGGLNFNVAITVPAMYKDGLVFDGVPFKSKTGLVKALPVPSPFENFIVLTYRISEGYHHIYHSRPLTTFGVFVHSASFQQGYRFYAGYNTNGSCRTRSLSSATIDNATSKGQICYNCEDLGHVFLCDTVNICSANEVCSVIQYIVSGQMKYRTGCQKLEACQNKQLASLPPNTTCFECCNDDYCNNKGCGEDDVPERQSRGPICYDCQYVSRTDECIRVSPCETTQTCRFEEYSWFGQSQFKMGCAEKLTCGMSSSSGRQVSKRASPLCHRCCSEDYCNSNCAATHSSVIVG